MSSTKINGQGPAGTVAPEQRTVLVTGASSGIGWCAVHGLRERGYRVFATARKPEDLARLRAAGLEAIPLDLANSASVRAAVAQVLDLTGGQLLAVFNNGAYGQPGAVEDLSREALRAQFEVNLFGTHELTRLVLPVMRKQGYGRIIQNSSVLGVVAMQFRGAYNASKFALEGLTDTLRLELRGTNIQVILIEPGPIASRFRDNSLMAFERAIDPETSPHRERYRSLLERLRTAGPVVPFTLPPEAVLQAVIKALESPVPRSRYPVTFPAHLFAVLKRVLPTWCLDPLLARY
jgi:NAD(P)-dependent dehydrogenase (short-subunit alcohol dehydrogenase family)